MIDSKSSLEDQELLEIARKVFNLEIEALKLGAEHLNDTFLQAVKLLDKCYGKVVITGLGKSGIAGKKIAATLSSTGVPSLFLHSGEAGHGDLGVVTKGDVIIALSYSGETRELVELMPRFKYLGVPVIALTGHKKSALAEAADVVLDVTVPNYPWPYGLLPTASNAVTVAVGDALAIALLMNRGVKEDQFAQLHPSGLLGQKLLVKVEHIMHQGAELPIVQPQTQMRSVVMEITAKRLGTACVVDEQGRMIGVITDGDLRRLLEKVEQPLALTAREVMTPKPKTLGSQALSAQALKIMEDHKITSLPIVSDEGTLIGLIHLHDILKLETRP